MISFTWCDWTWKSTIIKEFLSSYSWGNYTYIHYYHLAPKKSEAQKSSIKPVKVKNNNWVALKEIIYSFIFLLYLIFVVYIKRDRIILDRTFFDVKIDSESRLKSKIVFYWFGLIDTIFKVIFLNQLHILLTTNDFKTNLSRKDDETPKSMKYKFKQYENIKKKRYFIINTEENSIKQSIWKIKKLLSPES